MIRLILLALFCFALGNGWLVINWSKFFHDIGFNSNDLHKPIDWKEFVIDNIENEVK